MSSFKKRISKPEFIDANSVSCFQAALVDRDSNSLTLYCWQIGRFVLFLKAFDLMHKTNPPLTPIYMLDKRPWILQSFSLPLPWKNDCVKPRYSTVRRWSRGGSWPGRQRSYAPRQKIWQQLQSNWLRQQTLAVYLNPTCICIDPSRSTSLPLFVVLIRPVDRFLT